MVMLSCAPAGMLLAQGPAIEHDPVGCVRSERFPRLTARLSGETGRARVYFRASGTTAWYFVEMKPEAGLYGATLPKPKKDTKGFDYYIEALDTAMTQSRTADYSAAVVSGETCGGGKAMAAVASSASVVVGSPAGAPAVPAGFASSGVVTAAGAAAGSAAGAATGASAGGLSAGVIAGIAAAGAAGVAVAVTAGGSSDDGGADSGSGSSQGVRLDVSIVSVAGGGFPNIDVSACRPNTTFGGGAVNLQSDGSFNETWSVATPALRVAGRADASSFQASLSCLSGSGPTGSMTASGSNYTMSGSFSFGTQQGTISVRRSQ